MFNTFGSRYGAVVRALASHQRGQRLIPDSASYVGSEFVVGSRPCSERFFSGYSFYLKELSIPYISSKTLRSANEGLLPPLKCNLKKHGHRAFSYIAPKLWKALQIKLRTRSSLSTFKSQLFKRTFEL